MTPAPNFLFRTFAAISLATLFVQSAPAATTTVIYSFAGDEDGEYTDTDLVMDAAGNIYGSSVQGGAFGSGTVWRLSPSDGTWIHTVLYSFTGGADGGEPYKGVTLDANGNLYGTAVTGGSGSCEGGCGVAYKLTNSGGTWTQTVIHAFTGGDDGSGPGAGLTIGDDGDVYGMAPTGGALGEGTIYRMHEKKNGKWALDVIHTFTGGADGIGGSAGRLVFRGRHLYGTATAGGINSQGTVYELTPARIGEWGFRTLYSFKGTPDGGFPYGGLLFDALGNLYGTTYYAGANGLGCVYQLAPGHGGEWKEAVLYSFKGGSDGAGSIGNLVFDQSGNLYGTTSGGGTTGDGVMFKLAPISRHNWHENVVHSFQGPPDGAFAYNGMVGGGAGNFYGATVHGGANDEGAIYAFTP
jgi:uncharacterized repeat protein (TIGR03803 family)